MYIKMEKEILDNEEWTKDMPNSKDLKIIKKLPKKVVVGQYYQVKTNTTDSNECRLVTVKAMKKEGFGKFLITRNIPCKK
jgi:hypothetical protein